MTVIHLELWQFLCLIGGGITALWVLAKIIIHQATARIDQRFREITNHLNTQDDKVDKLQRELSEHRIELARDYVRREDYVQMTATIMNKIDALALNVQTMFRDLLRSIKGSIE